MKPKMRLYLAMIFRDHISERPRLSGSCCHCSRDLSGNWESSYATSGGVEQRGRTKCRRP